MSNSTFEQVSIYTAFNAGIIAGELWLVQYLGHFSMAERRGTKKYESWTSWYGSTNIAFSPLTIFCDVLSPDSCLGWSQCKL